MAETLLVGFGANDCSQLNFDPNQQSIESFLAYTFQEATDEEDIDIVRRPKLFMTESQRLKVKQVACGSNFTILVTENNKVYCCGNNKFNTQRVITFSEHGPLEELILPASFANKNIVKVSACDCMAALLTDENDVLFLCNSYSHIFGFNSPAIYKSQHFGHEKIQNIVLSKKLALFQTNSKIYAVGYDEYCQLGMNPGAEKPVLVFPAKNDRAVKKINYTACTVGNVVIIADNQIYVCGDRWGCDEIKKLSHPLLNEKKFISAACVGFYTFFLTQTNFCYGTVGWSGESFFDFVPNVHQKSISRISVPLNITAIYGQNKQLFFVTKDKKIYACGDNSMHQLGIASPGATTPNEEDGSAGSASPVQEPEETTNAAESSNSTEHQARAPRGGVIMLGAEPQNPFQIRHPTEVILPAELKGKEWTVDNISCGVKHTVILMRKTEPKAIFHNSRKAQKRFTDLVVSF